MSELNGKHWAQGDYLSLLTHAPAAAVKALAEAALEHLSALGEIEVLRARTGLVMLPCTDSVRGTVFHLGEVLVAEGHIRIANSIEGYGMVVGRDVQQAMAVAVLDAALSAGIAAAPIYAFLSQEAERQAAERELLLRQVEATRVQMETF